MAQITDLRSNSGWNINLKYYLYSELDCSYHHYKKCRIILGSRYKVLIALPWLVYSYHPFPPSLTLKIMSMPMHYHTTNLDKVSFITYTYT